MATIQKRPVEVEVRRAEPGEEIETREGTLKAEEGDYIITGVHGEEYPIGPEIMVKTYIPSGLDAIPLFREASPEGVVVEYEEVDDHLTRVSGVYVRTDGLTDEEKEKATRFAREFIRNSPRLSGDEVPLL